MARAALRQSAQPAGSPSCLPARGGVVVWWSSSYLGPVQRDCGPSKKYKFLSYKRAEDVRREFHPGRRCVSMISSPIAESLPTWPASH